MRLPMGKQCMWQGDDTLKRQVFTPVIACCLPPHSLSEKMVAEICAQTEN